MKAMRVVTAAPMLLSACIAFSAAEQPTSQELRERAHGVRREATSVVIADRAARMGEVQVWLSLLASVLSFAGVVLVVKSLDSAREANRIARIAAYNSQRAYVGTIGAVILTDEQRRRLIVVDYKNWGQTPATDVIVSIGCSIQENATPKTYMQTAKVGPIDPGMTNHYALNWRDSPQDIVLTGHFIAGMHIFVYLRIEYSDLDGRRHVRDIAYETQEVPSKGVRLALNVYPDSHSETSAT